MKSNLNPIKITIAVMIVMLVVGLLTRVPGQAVQGHEIAATTITVNTGVDFNTSMSESCATYPDDCSLRRAIVQARALAPIDRPATIIFNIPAEPGEGYDPVLGVWNLYILAPSDQYVFRDLTGGQIMIDGTSQPGGREEGPKIILIGPSNNKNGINISSGEDYEIRGLAFQQFSTGLMISGDNSLIEDNWFGLSADGTMPAWRNDDDHSQGSGSAGINMTSVANGNTIRGNYFLGLIGNAAAIRGEGNTFTANFVGTDSTGNVTGKLTDPSLLCTEVDWYGGSGLLADGPEHILDGNYIAGIRLDIFGSSSQPDAIWVESTCDRCVIQNNQIGVDVDEDPVGVCGQGIDITNGEDIQVINNTFANTYRTAIFLNGALYRDNFLSSNLITKDTPWLEPEEEPKSDGPIVRFSGLPDPFEFFNPAKVLTMDGLLITGTAGDSSPCPNCRVEVFLDDMDGIAEAEEYLGSAIADADGNWSLALASPIPAGFGVRTSSTSDQFNVIPGMGAGTTAGLSVLYPEEPPLDFILYLPFAIR